MREFFLDQGALVARKAPWNGGMRRSCEACPRVSEDLSWDVMAVSEADFRKGLWRAEQNLGGLCLPDRMHFFPAFSSPNYPALGASIRHRPDARDMWIAWRDWFSIGACFQLYCRASQIFKTKVWPCEQSNAKPLSPPLTSQLQDDVRGEAWVRGKTIASAAVTRWGQDIGNTSGSGHR